MKLWRLASRIVAAGFIASCISPANATVLPPPQGEKLLISTSLVTAPTLTTSRLDLQSAGTLYVSLSDLKWPEVAKALSFSLSSPTQVIAPTSNSGGLLAYDVTGPMTLFASVYAAPTATVGGALYHLSVRFASSAPPVPLPAAVWLLLSGLAGLGALGTRQTRSRRPGMCANAIAS
jgi:hypothetical protein